MDVSAKGPLMWEEAIVPKEKPQVQDGNHHTQWEASPVSTILLGYLKTLTNKRIGNFFIDNNQLQHSDQWVGKALHRRLYVAQNM